MLNLKKLREMSRLSQTDFAILLEVDKSYWAKCENKESISLKHFLKLYDYAETLGIPLIDGKRIRGKDLIAFIRQEGPNKEHFIQFEALKNMGIKSKDIPYGQKLLKDHTKQKGE